MSKTRKLNLIRLQKAWQLLKNEGATSLYHKVRSRLGLGMDLETEKLRRTSLRYDDSVIAFVGKKISPSQLLTELQQKASERFLLVISQDDYLNVVAGVQLRVADEQKLENAKGRSFLQIFPYQSRSTLDFSQSDAMMGINLDGLFLGYMAGSELLECLPAIMEIRKLDEVRLHHLIGHQMEWIFQLLEQVEGTPVFFWLHDFFSLCPNYPLLRNDKEYCHAPHPESNACLMCRYGAIRPRHYKLFTELFERFPLMVVAPSQFALDFWREKFQVKGVEGMVSPHATIEWTGTLPAKDPTKPLKVAFLGYPLHHKGWKTWLKLTDAFWKDPRYEFIHFSSDKSASRHFRRVDVRANPQNRLAMVEALRKEEIDLALLWSICPETFSYTLYEALAAGCAVITNPYSGNIQAVVSERPEFGLVLKDEAALMDRFEGNALQNLFIEVWNSERQFGNLQLNLD